MIVLIAVAHGPIMMAFPISAPVSFAAGLLSTPLISTPVFPTPIISTPIISMIVPTAVMRVPIVMGEQRAWLFFSDADQGWPRVAGSLGRSLNSRGFSG
ncbi:hypothetical protein ABXV19_20710 [Pseudomonas alkylphenolica]|jgi:hypothetical protein|nr:hypothetical protein [Pseudomonas sp. S11A 273]QYX49321.1 hypothetical protein K3F43_07385 [Pseudomonas sp. S11A 273]